MDKDTIDIREIRPEDNVQIEHIIRACFYEFNLPLEGTAYSDKETSKLYESYQGNNEVYYVLDNVGEVVGGAGIKPLPDTKGICEIQKMYIAPKFRGKGYGKQLFKKCLKSAKALGYKQCYLESATELETAIHIYETFGFSHIKKPVGNTGHYSCSVKMIKDL